MVATGSHRHFWHEQSTSALPTDVWDVWMDVSGWKIWDRGLADAEGSVAGLGATGVVIDKSGRRSPFAVVEYEEGRTYAFATKLPGGSLFVRRSIIAARPTRFAHEVRFTGVGGWVLSPVLGPGFRRDLPPTMAAVARRAEGKLP